MSEKFSNLDAAVLQEYLDRGLYEHGYQYVADHQDKSSPDYAWFSNAAAINAGVGPASVFARTQTAGGYWVSGVEPHDGQEISDDIAKKALSFVQNQASFDVPLSVLHALESEVVVGRHKLPEHLWTFSHPLTALQLTGDPFEFLPEDMSAGQWGQLAATTAASLTAAIYEAVSDGFYASGYGTAPEGRFITTSRALSEAVEQWIVDETAGHGAGGFYGGKDLDGDGLETIAFAAQPVNPGQTRLACQY